MRMVQPEGDRCAHCNLLALDALAAEQAVSRITVLRIWRHSECQHVLMWRSANGSCAEPQQQLPAANAQSAGLRGFTVLRG
jgi:hypothetical protein